MFTGKYPREVGAFDNKRLGESEETLPEKLSEAGFTTRAFSANPNISWPFGWDRGFDSFKGSWRLDPFQPGQNIFDWRSFIRRTGSRGLSKYPLALYECVTSDVDTIASLKFGLRLKLEDLGYRTHDDDGAKDAVSWIREMDVGEDEFLFVNLMEAHEPYLPPEGYRTVEYQSGDFFEATVGEPSFEPENVTSAYEDSVRYLSDVYKQMFDLLKSKYDLVVTVSDHGEMLGDDGVWGHVHGVYPPLTHIPMVLSGKMVDGGTDERVTSLLDLHATVLDVAGVDGFSRGESLLRDEEKANEESTVFIEDSGTSDERFQNLLDAGHRQSTLEPYRGSFEGIASGDRFDYETPHGIEGYPEDVAPDESASEEISQRSDEIPSAKEKETSEELTESARQQLRELGYI
ncbi:arylsulfatase [Haloferax larsenii]|uniref:Arylsulfatase n=1 Tax=Haloferax larsenii TaxID=302484 RepID=A0A1H7JK61_HALLR|nr:arylsulfatase [Haloferax larsenii]